MSYLLAGHQHEFVAALQGVPDGAPCEFRIASVRPPADGAAGPATVEELEGGCLEVRGEAVALPWTAQGPPTTGTNGQRSWRVRYEVKVDYQTEDQSVHLEANSPEVDVYHDWVELTTVKEDGSAQPNALFDLEVSRDSRTVAGRPGLSSGASGVVRLDALPPGDVRITFKPGWELVAWESGTGCALKAKVRRVPRARFVWPNPPRPAGPVAQGAPPLPRVHTQWVNLAADASHKERGSVCKLTLALDGGQAGEHVYVKTSYQAAQVSGRNDKVRGINGADSPLPAWAGAAPNTGKRVAVTQSGQAFTAEVEVECGVAGLDELTVSIGGSDRCQDESIVIKNMRKVKFEEIKPVAAISSFAGNGISAAIGAVLNQKLEAVGVQYEVARTATYALADIQAQNVVDGPYVGRAAGTKLVFLTQSAYDTLRSSKATQGAVKDTQTIGWCDQVVITNNVSGGVDTYRNHVIPEVKLSAAQLTHTHTFTGWERCFPHDWTSPANQAVTDIRWRAVEYEDTPGVWRPVAAGTPGASKMAWQVAPVATAADVAKFVTFLNWTQVRLGLPTATPTDPGNLLVDGGKALRIGVQVTLHICSIGVLAYASGGNIAMTTFFGSATANGAAEVILHETGHNMGQSVVDRSQAGATQTIASTGGTANFGRTAGPPGLAFAAPPSHSASFPGIVATGFMYTGKDHQGPHCARGLSSAQRGQPSFGNLPGSCIMFGETDITKAVARSFCAECQTLIRAEDLSDYRKGWWV